MLFVLYINDILDNVESEGLLFADDTKIYRAITSKEDAQSLQSDLNTLEEWSDEWLLRFHPDKCHVLTLGKFENIMHTERYKICNKELEHMFEEKDLGVIIDSELSFSKHIASKVRTANAIVGLIRRSFSFLDGTSFKKLYTAFVRPHLWKSGDWIMYFICGFVVSIKYTIRVIIQCYIFYIYISEKMRPFLSEVVEQVARSCTLAHIYKLAHAYYTSG